MANKEIKPGSIREDSTDTLIKNGESSSHPEGMPGQWKIVLGHGALVTLLMMGLATAMLFIVISNNTTLFNIGPLSSNEYFFLRQIPVSIVLLLGFLSSLLEWSPA